MNAPAKAVSKSENGNYSEYHPRVAWFLHVVMTVMHPMVMMSPMHPHPAALARVRLDRGRAAGLGASARGTPGALRDCQRAGQSQGRSQDKCLYFHGRFLNVFLSAPGGNRAGQIRFLLL
jgi:hypothetical protein